MKRLTERLENGVINVKYASQHETAIHRLVTIEDILGNEYDLDRLRELAEADREGRCVVLDVKIGQKVWILDAGEYGDDDEAYPLELNINGITLSEEHEIYYFIESPLGMYIDPFSHKDIGKTVFLTSEEADAALAKIATNCD